jgi:hypothetical protein
MKHTLTQIEREGERGGEGERGERGGEREREREREGEWNLASTKVKVSEITSEVGFSDQVFFSSGQIFFLPEQEHFYTSMYDMSFLKNVCKAILHPYAYEFHTQV